MNTECNSTTALVFIDDGTYLINPLGVALRLICIQRTLGNVIIDLRSPYKLGQRFAL
mgnify:CR=1